MARAAVEVVTGTVRALLNSKQCEAGGAALSMYFAMSWLLIFRYHNTHLAYHNELQGSHTVARFGLCMH